MKNLKTYRLALLGIFTGLIILMTFTPLGYIPLGLVSATTIHIPVIVAAIVLGWRFGAAIGGMAGVFCLIKAVVMPTSPTDVFFLNPVVSVLPRICIGIVTGLVFAGLCKLIKGKSSVPISAGIAAIAGTLTNTVLVLGFLLVFYKQPIQELLKVENLQIIPYILGSIVAINGIVEILTAVVIAVPVSTALLNVQKRLKV